MGKKVKEFKAGDFIFAKVKGYPAWPARIQRLNGKKYFIYFYGTGETANLANNVIFDYAENKDKFLNKTIKRKDFNDGVKQIEYDFANNISIEEVLGGPVADPADISNVTAGDTTLDDTSAADTTVNDTADESAAVSFTATIETGTADSDEGALVIDEGKKKKPQPGKAASTPKPVKAPKTPRGKKDDATPSAATEEDKEEIVSRSGRKIRPKRYADEQTEDNATLPSPIPKKRRTSGEKEIAEKPKPAAPQGEKGKNYVAFTISELEDIKETNAENIQKGKIQTRLYKTPSLQKTDLGHLLFGSLNILNEETSFSQISIEKSLSNELLDITHEQNKFEVTELLTSKDLESFSSVVSLNKIYKDLDAKSREDMKSEVLKSHEHKMLIGDDFFKMFDLKDEKIKNKKDFEAMSLVNGDMGVRKFYSDLCKEGNALLNGIRDAMESEKESILIACLPSGQYVGVKLFQSVPTSFKSDDSKLNWYRQAASNALTLHGQLEKGHITAQSVSAQLETDLNLTDEEKSNLDKEREIEEKKLRVQFLKTEMKLIELDAKIKSCLSLEKADTELCLKLIDELIDLDIKALMLLKHPTCLETVKRMRAYVGNTPSWELSEDEALSFTKHAHAIRKQADRAYKQFKDLFECPEGLSFWEFFSERVLQFKKCTQKLSADELLEMVHEPKELSAPSAHTMRAAIDAANDKKDETPSKKRNTPAKKRAAAAAAVAAATPSKEQPAKETPAKETSTKAPPKRQARNKKTEENEVVDAVVGEGEKDDAFNNAVENFEKGPPEKEAEKKPTKKQEKANKSKVAANKKKEAAKETANKKESETKVAENKVSETKVTETKDSDTKVTENNSEDKAEDKSTNEADLETAKPIEESKMDVDDSKTDEAKEVAEQNGASEKEAVETTEKDKDTAVVEKEDEPKAKRSRECNNKKSEPSTPTKTPTKKKSKS